MQATKEFVIKKREKTQFYLPRTKADTLDKSTEDVNRVSLSHRPSSKTKISITRSSNNLKALQLGSSPRNLDKDNLSHRHSRTVHLPSPFSTSGIESEFQKQTSIEEVTNNGLRSNTFTENQTNKLAQSPKFYTPTTKTSTSIKGSSKLVISCFDSASKIAMQASSKAVTETSLNER
jgi:hypothetical protein